MRTAVFFFSLLAAGVLLPDRTNADPTADRPSGVATTRQALPDSDARKKADSLVEEVFGQRVEAAHSASDKTALALKLIDSASEETNSAQKFALLNKARSIAVAAGDMPSAKQAVNEIVKNFQVVPFDANRATVFAVAKTAVTSEQVAAVGDFATEMIDDAIKAERFDDATKLHELAINSARKNSDAERIRRLNRVGRQLQKIAKIYGDTQPAREILNSKPDDPASNLAVGKYRCFYVQNWPAGLAMLAIGGDKELGEAARKDLADPNDTEARVAVGDLWWNLAEKNQDEIQEAMRLRSLKWYKLAVSDLSGLSKARLEKRIGQYADATADSPDKSDSPHVADSSGHASPSKKGVKGLLEYVTAKVKAKNTVATAPIGFTFGKTQFSAVPEGGGLLVGMDVCVDRTGTKVLSIRPIFLTAKGQVLGPVIGVPIGVSGRFVAKRGYAVGAITVNGALGVDGFGMTFMKIEDDGLSKDKSYDSPWFGNHRNDRPMGGDGRPIVGIAGNYDTRLQALGIVQVEKP